MSRTAALGAPVRALRRLSGRTPLRVKLVSALLALMTVALLVAGFAAAATLNGYLVGRIDDQLRDAARATVGRFGVDADGDSGGPGGRGGPGPPLRGYYAVWQDATGAQRGVRDERTGTPEPAPALPSLTYEQAVAAAARSFTVPSTGDGARWRVRVTPLVGNSGSVLIAASLAEPAATVRRLVGLELVIGAVVLVTMGAAGSWVVRRSLRPLREVETTAAAIAGGDLSRRVPALDPHTEVGALAGSLNTMLARIETAFREQQASEAAARRSEDRMRRFVTDASHELRTPLTSIRGFAELYRHGATDPADAGRLLRRIEGEAARMGVLVDDLLLLARLDQQRPLARDPVDLLGIAADAVHDARVADPARTVDLVVDADHPPVVIGDPARLRQVITNLTSNALTHTPAGTPVRVRLGTAPGDGDSAGWVVVEVTDRGPGLAAADAERVFERFYRADSSRTRASGGSGLGLSIVAALVAGHGGLVQLETAPGQGATFRVVLPAAPTDGPVEEPAPVAESITTPAGEPVATPQTTPAAAAPPC